MSVEVDGQRYKEIEIMAAEMETRLRDSVLRVLRPTLAQVSELDLKQQDLLTRVSDQAEQIGKVDGLESNVVKQGQYTKEWLRLIRDSEPDMITPVRIDPPHLTAWIRMMIASAFHPQVFRKANLTGKDLCMAGCSLRLCIEAGLGPDCFRNCFPCHWPFKVSELKDTGFTAAELRDAGFTDVTLLARAGFSTSDLEAAGFDRHEAAASAGFSARESFEGSFEASIAAAVAAGYDRPPVKAPPTLWPKGLGLMRAAFLGFTIEPEIVFCRCVAVLDGRHL
eukprot:s90_g36.t3